MRLIYKNPPNDIHSTYDYLELFFINLICGETNKSTIGVYMYWNPKVPTTRFQSAKMALWIALWMN